MQTRIFEIYSITVFHVSQPHGNFLIKDKEKLFYGFQSFAKIIKIKKQLIATFLIFIFH